jgi:CDP-4-dehydro-6-deoxyglucose reductase/terephthalate 1,2-dioxygenase reductase component
MAHTIRIAGTDVSFPCEPGQSVLDAALHAGIDMPYSCRKGVCGNCAGRIASGEVQCPPNEVLEPASGEHLYCQCVALGDLEIVPAAWRRVDPSARKTFAARVYRNQLAASDVSVLQLRLPAGQRAKFKAGQYLHLQLSDGSRRCYSMANAPHESDALTLHIRHLPGGKFTQIVPTLRSGDLLSVELPYGNFTLREEAPAPILCVAGGTGFAPVKSMLDDMVKRGIKRPVTLIWGARGRTGLYLMDAVQRWQRLLPEFRFLAAIEDAAEAAAMQPPAFAGRVDQAMLARFQSLTGYEVYCCGAPPMVAAVKKACVEERGLDPRHFFSDVFAPGPAASPP